MWKKLQMCWEKLLNKFLEGCKK
jgi:hypothetical protein